MNSYEEIIETEFKKVPNQFKKFIHKQKDALNNNQSWEYFSYGYSRAVQTLAEDLNTSTHYRDYFHMPIFFLSRHSIELNLKNAIDKYSPNFSYKPNDDHSLSALWKILTSLIRSHGEPLDDEWTAHCEKLINHLHEADPNGQKFRYPSDKTGKKFDFQYLEIEGLVRAHYQIVTYCEISIMMLEEMEYS